MGYVLLFLQKCPHRNKQRKFVNLLETFLPPLIKFTRLQTTISKLRNLFNEKRFLSLYLLNFHLCDATVGFYCWIFFLIFPLIKLIIKYNTVNKLLVKHSFSLLIVFKLFLFACAAVGVAFVLLR